MDIPIIEPTTPSLQSYNNVVYWKTEDSGYHTSFTPGSTERSSTYTESSPLPTPKIVIRGHIQVTKSSKINFHVDSRCNHTVPVLSPIEGSSPVRRGIKRPLEEDWDTTPSCDNTTATPTSIIAGEIKKLDVNDSVPTFPIFCRHHLIDPNEHYSYIDHEHVHQYPTTPVKKICKSSCKLSPFNRRKFARRVEFATHSLSCERKCLQPVKPIAESSIGKFRPNQKIDIIKLLCDVELPLIKIIGYLSSEDIYNFKLVSKTWNQAWVNVGEHNPKKQEYNEYWNAVSTNQENWENGTVPKLPGANQARALREIDNEMNYVTRSTPSTPRTNKFKKFVKEASLDSRPQLSCINCQYPAKVTKEVSGEEWAECTNATCSYQFCKLCKSNRHPGTNCYKYDLSEVSPPKRKKNLYSISSKKSKKNLHRLLDQCKRT